ncbi:MAG: hypothetical protein K9K79_13920 [Desulfohalobiaceae bacterium]|nr:hypothetical protein [Desulfohalobiaceae bacterium]
MSNYKAIVSSDWNECLAPTGPFDPILFHYPDLEPSLRSIFKRYTSNEIPLSRAMRELQSLLPPELTAEQIDAYLEDSFCTYKGVPQFIDWCREHDILFLINTTAFYGFFQRVLAKDLLPRVAAVSAHPMLCYPESGSDPDRFYPLLEIEDKGKNTAKAMADFRIPKGKVVVVGDSGGDGPHFAWAGSRGGLLVASRPKSTLEAYCQSRGLSIDIRIGAAGEDNIQGNPEEQADFMDCIPEIEAFLDL